MFENIIDDSVVCTVTISSNCKNDNLHSNVVKTFRGACSFPMLYF
jgi:hypothetical protein